MNQRWLYKCFVTMIFGLLAVFFRVLSIIFQVWIMLAYIPLVSFKGFWLVYPYVWKKSQVW